MAYLEPGHGAREAGGKAPGGRVIGFTLLGMMLGAVAGGILGLVGGFAWTALAGTSAFEGYAGVVTALWMLGGIVVGFFAGAVKGAKTGRKA